MCVGGGGDTLPYISHIGFCHHKGRVFVPFWSEDRHRLCPLNLVYNQAWFSRELPDCMNVFIVSIPNE